MAVPLSPATEQRLSLLFPPTEQDRIRRSLIDDCGENIPGWNLAGLERLRCAVLKLSGGQEQKFQQALAVAKVDLRDVLVSSLCGDDVEAHLKWLPERKW